MKKQSDINQVRVFVIILGIYVYISIVFNLSDLYY